MNRRDIFFNSVMSAGVITLMIGIIGRSDIVTIVSGVFVFIIWLSFLAVRRNDESRKQLEELKKRLEAMQNGGTKEPDENSEANSAEETPEPAENETPAC